MAASQVAFGYGGASNTIRSYGAPKGGIYRDSQGSPSVGMLFTNVVFLLNRKWDISNVCRLKKNHVLTGGTFPSKEYREPWVCYNRSRCLVSSSELFSTFPLSEYGFFWILLQDYCSYYPATLPLRRPYSGNPGMSCGIYLYGKAKKKKMFSRQKERNSIGDIRLEWLLLKFAWFRRTRFTSC